MPRYKGNVVFKDVSFAYKKDYVLSNISFKAHPGRRSPLSVIPVRAKAQSSTCCSGSMIRKKEAITIDGTEGQRSAEAVAAHHMGIVLQDPYLFTGTIASNVSLGDERISRERVEHALRDVGAELPGPFAARLRRTGH